MYQPFPGGAEPPEQRPRMRRPAAVYHPRGAGHVRRSGGEPDRHRRRSDDLQLAAALARHPKGKNGQLLTHAQVVDLAHVEVVALVVGGLIAAGLWIWLARSSRAGKSWARVVSTVLFAISTISAFVSVGGRALTTGDATRIYGFVVWIVGLAAIVLLWQRASSDYFKGARATEIDAVNRRDTGPG